MNNIYKVIWSKAKNCYVVASEIARSHTKSASGSEKIGGVTRRSLLASLMALSLLCGGLGVASAVDVVHVDESAPGTAEVYTKTGVDNLLKEYGKKENVETNKNDIITLRTTTTDQGQKITENATNIANNKTAIEKKIDTETANATYATKDALNNLTTTVNGKADVTALEDKANKTDLEDATKRITANEGNITDLQKKTAKLSADGTALTDMTTVRGTTVSGTNVEAGTLKVTGQISDGTVNTTLAEIDASMKQTETNKENIANLKTTTGEQDTAIKDLQKKTTNISYADGAGTSIDGITVKDGNIVGNGNSAITGLTNVETSQINGKSLTGTTVATEKEVKDVADAVKTETDERKAADTALEEKIAKNTKDIATLDGNVTTAQGDIQTNSNAIADTNKRTAGIKRDDVRNETTIEGNVTVDNLGNVTAGGKLKGAGVEAGAVNAGSLIVENASNLKGDVTMDKTLKVTGDTSLKGTKVDGKLTVTDEADLKNTKVEGTLGVTGETTLKGALTAEKNATFEKDVTVEGTTNLKDTTVNGDLKVTGTITTDKMVFGDKAHNNYTEIDQGKVTSKNSVVNGEGQLITSSSIFNAEENKVGFANNATGDQSFHKQTSDVIMDNVKDRNNSNNRTQTKTETKDIITDENGNSSTTSQTASENKTYLTDKDGKNTNSTIDTAKGYDKTIKGENGETSTKQDELNITNTAQNGTIKNEAKDIVNNATGNMTNTVGADLTTTVGGHELHEVIGTKTENVTGKVTENYKAGQETNVTGDQDIHVTGKQTNKIDGNQENTIGGNQTTTVTGDISNTAKNITNEATTKLTDKVGANTRVLDGEGITDTVGGSTFKQRIDAIMGNVKTADGESEVTQKGDEINSVVGKGEATNSRVTQKKGSIEAAVTDGINTNDSYDVANASAKVLSGGTKVNKLQDNLDSSEKTITDGTYTTSKVQTALDITNTAKDGTITNDAKNIVNKASGDMTNTVGGKLTTTVTGATEENYNGGLTTKVTGEEKHTVTGKQTNTVEGGQENIISGGQTNTITGGQVNNITGDQTTTITGNKKETVTENVTEDYQKNLTTTVGGNEIHDVKGTKTETVEGKVTENFKGGQETNVTGDQDIHVTGKQTNKIDGDQENTIGGNQTTTVTGDISNKAKNITNEASNSITDKVGDHTRVLDSDGITDTVGGSTFKQRIDKIMMESKNVSIKAEETLTNEAKVITNKASEVINNEAININNTATGIITSKASEIKNEANQLISNKVGENTWENMEDGKITTSIKNGTKQNLTQSDAEKTEHSVVNGSNSTVNKQTSEEITDAVTNGTTTNVTQNTATSSNNTIADTNGNVNTVVSTVDGTKFTNTGAKAAIGEGTVTDTSIKGNTITTGKVTMDYAEVMKDLGVRGNANIAGKTTTGELEVTGKSTLKGDVTMESNATVKKDLTVEGTTTTKTLKVTENATVGGTLDVAKKATFGDSVSIAKDLSVDGNATIKGDVTAKSYKVGDKTYISAAGINANDQKITNVADGSISEGSKDAVNGGQLYTVKNDLEGKVNKVGANAAAMANLHPMEFDPDSKWNIAAAIGNYGSETAAALGAFYRPNDDVMVNLSTAFGTGENMVGGGVSVRLGKGGNKLSREESNALKAQVDNLTARMDALLSVLNPNMSKDFPDVPENHWAYEAVSRLAGNDIVQGYPDGEFHGERTMTRYEMAEIIYNALSRGAEAEKELVEEFKPELQAMAASEKATAEKAEG